jgi:4-amino-4-deoxy-L-arabinose transferase-like glycosyltransferase
VTQSQPGRKIWPLLAVVVVGVVAIAGVVWSIHNPLPVHWDEAIDLNDVQIDTQRLQHGMLLRLAGRIFVKSLGRPPAYRILALPFLGLFGFHAVLARLTTILCFAASCGFVYAATRRLANRAASAFAALLFTLSPVVVSASVWYSTEGPLYLATAAMVYYLFVCWDEEPGRWYGSIGLGLAIGLGLLSKASFIAISVPLMAYAFFAGFRRSGLRGVISLIKAGAIAAAIAVPWWLMNLRASVDVAKQARGFVANSLGSPSLHTWIKWLETVVQSLLGYALAAVICLVVLAWIYSALARKNKGEGLGARQKNALWACLFAGVPILLIQLSGTNHLLRHISPALIPFAILIG